MTINIKTLLLILLLDPNSIDILPNVLNANNLLYNLSVLIILIFIYYILKIITPMIILILIFEVFIAIELELFILLILNKMIISLLEFIVVIIPLVNWNWLLFELPISPIIFIFLLEILLLPNYKTKSLTTASINNALDNNIVLKLLVNNKLLTIESIPILINSDIILVIIELMLITINKELLFNNISPLILFTLVIKLILRIINLLLLLLVGLTDTVNYLLDLLN